MWLVVNIRGGEECSVTPFAGGNKGLEQAGDLMESIQTSGDFDEDYDALFIKWVDKPLQ